MLKNCCAKGKTCSNKQIDGPARSTYFLKCAIALIKFRWSECTEPVYSGGTWFYKKLTL